MSAGFVAASSQYLEVGSAWKTARPFTVNCWVKFDPASEGGPIWMQLPAGAGANYHAGNTTAADAVRTIVVNGSGSDAAIGETIGDTDWHMCTFILSSTDLISVLDADWANRVTTASTREPSVTVNTTRIGYDSFGPGYYQGDVAELAVWDVALGQTEVELLYFAAGVGRYAPEAVPADLLNYYPLDEVYTVSDAWGSAHFTNNNGVTFDDDDHPVILRVPRNSLAMMGAGV